MILVLFFPPLLLLVVSDCEDKFDGREEEVAEDVGDGKPVVDNWTEEEATKEEGVKVDEAALLDVVEEGVAMSNGEVLVSVVLESSWVEKVGLSDVEGSDDAATVLPDAAEMVV